MGLSNFIGGGIVLILGCAMRAFDAYDGLSGFSTMKEEEKKKWDIIAAGRFITAVMIAGGVILVAGGVLCLLDIYPMVSAAGSWGLMVALILCGIIYTNTSGKFKRKG